MQESLEKVGEKFLIPISEYENASEFSKLVYARRSVRKFTGEDLDDEKVRFALKMGLLAPNSSNLQAYQFLRIKKGDLKDALAYACMNQSAAKTASELIVCLARTDLIDEHCELMMEELSKKGEVPAIVQTYYKKLAPFVYNVGLFSWKALLKFPFFFISGFFKPTPRGPLTHNDLLVWAQKSCALACENIMLGLRATGLDSCPMEGYDEWRVRKILKLKSGQHLCMILAVGKAMPGGIYGESLRFDENKFIVEL